MKDTHCTIHTYIKYEKQNYVLRISIIQSMARKKVYYTRPLLVGKYCYIAQLCYFFLDWSHDDPKVLNKILYIHIHLVLKYSKK